MAKVNFSKVEDSFDKALLKLQIENLNELAAIADLSQESKKSAKGMEEIAVKFKKELDKLKKRDPHLFDRLNLTKEAESKLAQPASTYSPEDWARLKELKERIEQLKKDLSGKESLDAENETLISKERKKHINKRFNVRDDWLPLH
jgi:hypothetical protein